MGDKWEYKNCTITVDQWGSFTTTVDETELNHPTFEGLKKEIDKALRTILKGNRVKVVVHTWSRQWREAIVTSRAADEYGGPTFWVSYQDTRGIRKREKVRAKDIYKREDEKVKRILELQEQISALTSEIEQIEKSLEFPLEELLKEMGLPVETGGD